MDAIGDLVVRAATAATRAERVEAYGRLVERFRDMACGYACSILGDFHLAEDAAHEAFIVAFDKLGQLERPEAFPGWFRRIVWSSCGRMARRSRRPTVGLETAGGVPSQAGEPLGDLEHSEMRDRVLKAIGELPATQREVTTLFYINGYSQADIADFLEVPVGTVKSRLRASRGRLKERMLHMVEQTLHGGAPDERFDEKVVRSLLARPNLLHIDGHPVRRVLDAMREALAEFEFVEAQEVVEPPAGATDESLAQAFRAEGGRILSYETTISVLHAAKGRRPPVHLIAAGRSFRAVREGPWHSKAFHQMDALCIESGASDARCVALFRRALAAALGNGEFVPGEVVPLWYARYHTAAVNTPKGPVQVGGYGMLTAGALAEMGFDPKTVGGYAVDFGLDRLAMLTCGVADVHHLWQPPYVT